jgi:hypothetical protein
MAGKKKPAKATKFKGTLGRQFYVTYPEMWQALSAELPMPISAMARQLTPKPKTTNSMTPVDPARLAVKLDAAIANNLKELGDGG